MKIFKIISLWSTDAHELAETGETFTVMSEKEMEKESTSSIWKSDVYSDKKVAAILSKAQYSLPMWNLFIHLFLDINA